MVPRGGIEPPTLRFSGTFSINSIKHLAKQQTENPSKNQGNWKTAARAQCCPSPPNRLASPTIDQNLHGADAPRTAAPHLVRACAATPARMRSMRRAPAGDDRRSQGRVE